MRPNTPSSLVKHYPLAIGLLVLLFPYFYRLLLFPFTVRNSLSTHGAGNEDVSTTSRISVSTSSSSSTSSSVTSTSTKRGYNIWKGVRQFVGPKAEEKDDKRKQTHSVSTKKQKSKRKPVPPAPTSIKTSTVKSTKTVTKSFTKSVTKSVTQSITKSITETVQLTLEKEVEPSSRPHEADNVVVIEEIDSMGWHQVQILETCTDN